MKKLKVYGGSFIIRGKQMRSIIASSTIKQALEVLKDVCINYSYFKDYWCETGNEKELEEALKQPYTLFYKDLDDWNGEFKLYEELK